LHLSCPKFKDCPKRTEEHGFLGLQPEVDEGSGESERIRKCRRRGRRRRSSFQGSRRSEELRRICMDGWVMAGAIGFSQGYAKAWQGWQSPKQAGSSP